MEAPGIHLLYAAAVASGGFQSNQAVSGFWNDLHCAFHAAADQTMSSDDEAMSLMCDTHIAEHIETLCTLTESHAQETPLSCVEVAQNTPTFKDSAMPRVVLDWVIATIKKCSRIDPLRFKYGRSGNKGDRCSPSQEFFNRSARGVICTAYLPHVTHMVKGGAVSGPANVYLSFAMEKRRSTAGDTVQFVLSSNKVYHPSRLKEYKSLRVRCATEFPSSDGDDGYKAFAFQLDGHRGCLVVRLTQREKQDFLRAQRAGLGKYSRDRLGDMPSNYVEL